jgi:hypothetical protein
VSIRPSPNFLRTLITALVLVLYVAMAFITQEPALEGDEIRYVNDALNLKRGEFGQPGENHFIGGPGYGSLLMPFTRPENWIWGRCMNAVYLAGAVWLLFGLIERWSSQAWAAVASLAIGTHPAIAKWVTYLMSEPVSLLCVVGIMVGVENLLLSKARSGRWVVVTGLVFGWLILTRVIFGYVALALLVIAFGLMLVHRPWRATWQRLVAVCLVALVVCVPYLSYTYAKTGRLMCWSTTGGEMLYWMTSTRDGERGSWFDVTQVASMPELEAHREFYLSTFALPGPERDRVLSARAMEQLKANPVGVAYNWICTQVRQWFGFPRAFHVEGLTRALYLLWNGPLVLGLLVMLCVGWRRVLSMGPVPTVLLLFAAIYYGGMSLAPGQPRYLVIILPVLWFWLAVAFTRWLSVSLKDAKAPSIES